MKHWDKYENGGIFDAFDFDNKMALINLNMIYEYSIKLDEIVTEETQLEEWVKMKLTRIEQNISDIKHSLEGWEKFNHGGMIFKKQLLTISKYAKSLIDMVKGGSKLMSWQEGKLAISANDIDGIYHHLDYKIGNRTNSNYKFKKGGGISSYPDLSKEQPMVIKDSIIGNFSEIDIKLVRKNIDLKNKIIRESRDAFNIFMQLWDKDKITVQEQLNVIFVSSANEVIGYYQHTTGGVDSTIGDSELIASLAIKTLSKGVIIAHNHPSGRLFPSDSDKKLYQDLKKALDLFRIRLLDSLIVAPNSNDYYSFADDGYEMGGNITDKKEIEIQDSEKNTFVEFRVPSTIFKNITIYIKVFFRYEEIEQSYLHEDTFIDENIDAYVAYEYEDDFVSDDEIEITDEQNNQLKLEAKQIYDSYFHNYTYDGLKDKYGNYKPYKPYNKYELGGVLSNNEIIKNIDFSDNTDRRLGRYDFSFETEDSEGASMFDYDGYIIEAPSSSRMNDEIEWGQNVPEDWENAEKYILDEFYNWKLKRFKTGGGVESGVGDYDSRWAEMEAYSPYERRTEYLQQKEDISDLAFASKKFSKSAEMLVRENLQNGEICICKLTKILGHKPNYPKQVVGSLTLTKSFFRNFYKI